MILCSFSLTVVGKAGDPPGLPATSRSHPGKPGWACPGRAPLDCFLLQDWGTLLRAGGLTPHALPAEQGKAKWGMRQGLLAPT